MGLLLRAVLALLLVCSGSASPVMDYFQGRSALMYHPTDRRRLSTVRYDQATGRPKFYEETWPTRSPTDYKPIRIYPYFVDANLPDASLKSFLKERLLPATTEFFSQALRVVPVSGALKVPRRCGSVYPSSGRCAQPHTMNICGTSPQNLVPASHLGDLEECTTDSPSSCSTLPGGAGIDTDYILYVSALHTTECDGTDTIAYASKCFTDQFDRPTVGAVNFCPNHLDTSTNPKVYSKQFATAIHELCHALGFEPDSLGKFRDPLKNGEPRTPRTATGDLASTEASFVCPNGKVEDSFALPAANTVQVAKERGLVVAKVVTPTVRRVVRDMFDCPTLAGAPLENQDSSCLGSHWEERLFDPLLMSAVSNEYSVFSRLTLAYFEDSGWYIGNWSVASNPALGYKAGCAFAEQECLTLAEDGGGSKVVAQPAPQGSYGFCTEAKEAGCAPDLLALASCAVSAYSGNLPEVYRYFPSGANLGGPLMQADYCPYYVSYSNGQCEGDDAGAKMDLQVVSSTTTDATTGVLSTTSGPASAAVEGLIRGASYGADSRCVRSTLSQPMEAGARIQCTGVGCTIDRSLATNRSYSLSAPDPADRIRTDCFRVACVSLPPGMEAIATRNSSGSNSSGSGGGYLLMLRVRRFVAHTKAIASTWVNCSYDGERVAVAGFDGHIECPRSALLCADGEERLRGRVAHVSLAEMPQSDPIPPVPTPAPTPFQNATSIQFSDISSPEDAVEWVKHNMGAGVGVLSVLMLLCACVCHSCCRGRSASGAAKKAPVQSAPKKPAVTQTGASFENPANGFRSGGVVSDDPGIQINHQAAPQNPNRRGGSII